MRSHAHGALRAALAFALLIAIGTPTACTEDSTTSAGAAATPVNQYFLGLPSWDLFSPQLPSADSIAGNSTVERTDVGGTNYDCTTTPYSITETPDKIVTLDPDVNILWLGALLQGNGYRNGVGSLTEWTVRERAPLEISIDLLSRENTRTVEHPDLASVQQAVGQLVAAADSEGHHGGSSISFSQENTYSVNQAMLKLGVSAGYASVTVKASLSASRTAAERTVTAYFVQRMFTVSMVLPNQPRDLFSADFDQARLQEEEDRGHVGPNNIPVYVSSMTYGRILMFSFTSTASITDIRAALSASFSSIAGGSISGRYLDILNQAKISVVTVGGEGKNATALIQSGQLKDYFDTEPALTSARPISYVVRNVGDNSIAKVSETTAYDLRECTAVPTTGTMVVDVSPNDASVYVSGPDNYTAGPNTGDQHLADLPAGGYTITVSKPGYDSMTVDTTVIAGEETDLYPSLHLKNTTPTGAYYTVYLSRLLVQNASCTGESQADVYYSITINGNSVASVGRANSIPLYAGQATTIDKSFSDTIRTDITMSVTAFDADPLNADDPMGSKTATWSWPNIPTGTDLYITVTYSGCSYRVYFNITKGAEVFTTPPAPTPLMAARGTRSD